MRRECFAKACSDSCTVGVIEVRNSDDMLITCDIIIGLQLERDSAIYYVNASIRWVIYCWLLACSRWLIYKPVQPQ